MSTKYQNSADVPLDVIIARLKELSDAVAGGRESQGREFTMRIPAECDRDADLVIGEAARRLEQAQTRVAELEKCVDDGSDAWLLRKQAAASKMKPNAFDLKPMTLSGEVINEHSLRTHPDTRPQSP